MRWRACNSLPIKMLGIRRINMVIIKILSFVALVCSVTWFVYTPDFEPVIAIITSLSALIAAWVARSKEEKNASQTQTVGDNSVGIQFGGNVTFRDLNVKGNSDHAE